MTEFSSINEMTIIYDPDGMLKFDKRGDSKVNAQK